MKSKSKLLVIGFLSTCKTVCHRGILPTEVCTRRFQVHHTFHADIRVSGCNRYTDRHASLRHIYRTVERFNGSRINFGKKNNILDALTRIFQAQHSSHCRNPRHKQLKLCNFIPIFVFQIDRISSLLLYHTNIAIGSGPTLLADALEGVCVALAVDAVGQSDALVTRTSSPRF